MGIRMRLNWGGIHGNGLYIVDSRVELGIRDGVSLHLSFVCMHDVHVWFCECWLSFTLAFV
jgi:hypothetical protein